ncbi:hypothetical protein [Actinomadura parmotrematis]|uniref:DUF4333 domain-containing protein n=1 Tax=Actinomadura parmotrematis TaxID=2864039 RepID=A0ABS7FZA3_9ACTN|nr:hypothetical protein [Actinomadura parmotrematis]MBW8485780.1 hypothetical protein [Actinomadura parmotrematis]
MRRGRAAAALALALLVGASSSGCRVMQRISEGAYRNAVTDGTIAELSARGVRLAGRPACAMPAARPGDRMTISCTASTATGEPVRVSGTAAEVGTRHPRELYVITVAGRELLRKDCLGLGCAHRSADS